MTEWISVKKRLPRKAGLYLVVDYLMGVIEKGEFDGRSRWHINAHNFEVTHWMPLPEAPNDQISTASHLNAFYG